MAFAAAAAADPNRPWLDAIDDVSGTINDGYSDDSDRSVAYLTLLQRHLRHLLHLPAARGRANTNAAAKTSPPEFASAAPRGRTTA